MTLPVVVTMWDQASFSKESTPRTSESCSLLWSCAAANDSFRCLEETFEELTVLLLRAQTREKIFTALRNPVHTCRESNRWSSNPSEVQ